MAVTIIENQAIRFRLLTEIEAEDCACSSKPYCQKVNKFDIGKVQILSNNIVVNGDFENGVTGWTVQGSLLPTIVTVNETSIAACDGTITVILGGPPVEYSLDGITFQLSNVFSGLCAGCYDIVVKNSIGQLGFITGCISVNITCGDFTMTNELLPYQTSNLLNCLTSDFI